MDTIIARKAEQVLNVQQFLEKAIMSNEGYDSTQEPFFQRNKATNLQMNYKDLPEIPESLNRHIKIIYEYIGNPDIEVYIGDWTIMSLHKSLQLYNQYCNDDQKKVFDIAFQYAGMGHINVLSCDLENHLLFKRQDGGSDGWDREANYKELLNYKSENYHHMYFTQWKNEIIHS